MSLGCIMFQLHRSVGCDDVGAFALSFMFSWRFPNVSLVFSCCFPGQENAKKTLGKHVFLQENMQENMFSCRKTCFPDVFLVFSWPGKQQENTRKTTGKHQDHNRKTQGNLQEHMRSWSTQYPWGKGTVAVRASLRVLLSRVHRNLCAPNSFAFVHALKLMRLHSLTGPVTTKKDRRTGQGRTRIS